MIALFTAALLQAEPAGTADQVTHFKVAHAFREPERADGALEARAKNSSLFGARYAALLLEIRRSLETGTRHEATFMALAQASSSGGPKGAAEHLRALALSFKKAVYCKECRDGKVTCPQCQGKRKVDIACKVCGGKGRVRAPGAAPGADVTHKCRNCEGRRILKGVGCPTCSQQGVADCGACLGKPWRDKRCAAKGCQNGRVTCPTCQGKGKVPATCGDCEGKGRVQAPGAVNAVITQRCNPCDGKGVLKEPDPCPACSKSAIGIGLAPCACRGGENRVKAGASLADVFSTDPCAACSGKGWPDPKKAEACPRCLGLGVRVAPAADPSKRLE